MGDRPVLVPILTAALLPQIPHGGGMGSEQAMSSVLQRDRTQHNVTTFLVAGSVPALILSLYKGTKSEDVLGSGGIAPRIIYLGAGWRCVVSFTPSDTVPSVLTEQEAAWATGAVWTR